LLEFEKYIKLEKTLKQERLGQNWRFWTSMTKP